MTVSSTKRRSGPYSGNGSTTTFPFEFKVFDKFDLRVIHTNEIGFELPLLMDHEYTVQFNADQENSPGGNIITKTPPDPGTKITILSFVDYKQPVKLTNMGGFYPEVINVALDRMTILCQQLLEQMDRAVKVQASDDTDPDELIDTINKSATLALTGADQARHYSALAEELTKQAGKSAEYAKNYALSVRRVGDQKLSPFRSEAFWYLMNGDNFLLTSPQGQALNGLSADYKADWGIVVSVVNGQNVINVPNYFDAAGNGYFDRAVDGTNRRVGSKQGDAIRNIYGYFGFNGNAYCRAWWISSGAFVTNGINPAPSIQCASNSGQSVQEGVYFDAALQVPVAAENRPINIGKTPLIYLGV